MSHRRPRRSDFAGKTIKRVDSSADNIWRFHFTDGSAVAIESEIFSAGGSYGSGLACMFICDECAMEAA